MRGRLQGLTCTASQRLFFAAFAREQAMQCVFLLALVAALKADTKQQAKVNPVEKVTEKRIIVFVFICVRSRTPDRLMTRMPITKYPS